MRPLPGQMGLFDIPAGSADEAQAAAGRRGRCNWGDCRRPAVQEYAGAGERFCRQHLQLALRGREQGRGKGRENGRD